MAETTLNNKEAATLTFAKASPDATLMDVRLQYVQNELSNGTSEALRTIYEFKNSPKRREISGRLLLTDVSTDGKRKPKLDSLGVDLETPEKVKVDALTDNYLKYIREGFSKLTAPEKKVLRDQMLNVINSNPNFKDVLGEGLNTAKRQTLDNLLTDENMRGALADVLGETFSDETSKKAIDVERRILEAVRMVKQKEDEIAAIGREKVSLTTQQTNITAEQVDFLSDPNKLAKLAHLHSTSAVALQQATEKVQSLQAMRAKARNSVTDQDLTDAVKAQGALESSQEMKDYRRLLGEQQSIELRLKGVTDRIGELDSKVPMLESDKNGKEYEYQTLLSEREGLARQFQEEVEHAVEHAAAVLFTERTNDNIKRSTGLLEKASDAATEEARVKVETHVKTRWQEMDGRRFGRERPRINKELALEDFDALMRTGPEGLSARVIDSMDDLTPEEKDLLKSDPKYLSEYGQNLAAITMGEYYASGGKFTKDELDFMTKTDWADGTIDSMLERNQETKALFEKMKEKGMLSSTKMDALREKLGSKGLMTLLLILAGIITFAVGGPIIASAAGPLGRGIMEIIGGLGDSAGSVAKTVGDGIGGGIGNAGGIGDQLGQMGAGKDGMISGAGGLKDSVINAAGGAKDAVINTAGATKDTIVNTVTGVAPDIQGPQIQLPNGIPGAPGIPVDAAGGVARSVGDQIAQMGAGKDRFLAEMGAGKDGILNGMGDGKDNQLAEMGAGKDRILGNVGRVKDAVLNAAGATKDNIVNTVTGVDANDVEQSANTIEGLDEKASDIADKWPSTTAVGLGTSIVGGIALRNGARGARRTFNRVTNSKKTTT